MIVDETDLVVPGLHLVWLLYLLLYSIVLTLQNVEKYLINLDKKYQQSFIFINVKIQEFDLNFGH